MRSRTPELIESEHSGQAEMTRDTWPRWSACSIPPRKSPPHEPLDGPLAARMRPRRLDEFVGQEHLLGEGSALRASLESGAAALDGALRAARARARRRSRGSRPSTRARRSRSCRRSTPGRAEVREVIARATRAERRAARPRDDLLPRRDPPLQQGPAGRAAPRGRGGPGDADRGDDGEPLLRGQLRAALARAGLRAAGARRRPTSRRCCGGRSSAAPARGSRCPTRSSRSSPCAPAATRGRR